LRYGKYKDSDEMLRLKLQQLDYINAGRAKYNASPVQLDILASRVANKMCREAAEGDFTGRVHIMTILPVLSFNCPLGIARV